MNIKLSWVDIFPGDSRLVRDLFPVIRELRPFLTDRTFLTLYEEAYPQGLRYTAAYHESGHCLALAGWRVITTSRGRIFFVDDLVTASEFRSLGVGAALMAELERRARQMGCELLELDSGVQRHDAHRFYFRQGMSISSYHFRKELSSDS